MKRLNIPTIDGTHHVIAAIPDEAIRFAEMAWIHFIVGSSFGSIDKNGIHRSEVLAPDCGDLIAGLQAESEDYLMKTIELKHKVHCYIFILLAGLFYDAFLPALKKAGQSGLRPPKESFEEEFFAVYYGEKNIHIRDKVCNAPR